jgi:hypothetical protein
MTLPAWHQASPAKTWRLTSFGAAWLALAWAMLDTHFLGIVFGDAASYWRAWHGPLYDPVAPLWVPHFIYAPPAALAFWPLAQLPEVVFVVTWWAAGTAVYTWLLAPLPWPSRVPALLAGTVFALNGNIEWVLALVAVLGLRWPPLWLIALFTKAAPFLGIAWFFVRGEWRAVASTVLFGLVLVALSALLLPNAWPTWVGMVWRFGRQTELTSSTLMPPVPFAVRFVSATVLVWWGARRNQPLVLPFVIALCQPDLQPWAFGLLAAVPRLREFRRAVDPTGPAGAYGRGLRDAGDRAICRAHERQPRPFEQPAAQHGRSWPAPEGRARSGRATGRAWASSPATPAPTSGFQRPATGQGRPATNNGADRATR